MKKIACILAMLLFITSMAFGAYIEIGDGTSTIGYVPAYGLYDYSWSQVIYLQSEIGDAIDINKISYNVSTEPDSYTMPDQKIYMKHTADATFPDAAYDDPATAGFTLVYDGPVTWDGSGWNDIMLDTPFSYNGTDNLIVYWQNWDGDWTSGYPQFYYTSQTDRAKYKFQDTSFPEVAGTLGAYVANIRLHYPYDGPEIYLSASSYDFGMIEADTDASFDLTIYSSGTEDLVITDAVVAAPFSCDYSGGTIPAGENVVTTVWFEPTEAGEYSDTLTFEIDGDFAGMNTALLTGSAYPSGYVFESFEGDIFPPLAWDVQNVAGQDWAQYSSGSPPDGSKHARLYYVYGTGSQSRLITPELLPLNSGDFTKFMARYYSAGTLTIQYSTDKETWTDLETVPITTTYDEYTVDLSSLADGESYYLAFYGETGTGYSYIYFDAVYIPEPEPYSIITLSPVAYDFGSILTGSSASLDVGIKNAGIGDLTISGISGLDAPFSCDYTGGVLAPDDSVTISILFDGSVPGVYADTLVIESDADYGEGTVALSGAVYDPFTELSEDFEGCTAPDLPLGWSKIVQSTSTYPYVNTYSSATYAHSGVMSVKMYNSSDLLAELLLITPALITSANGNRVMFWARSSSGTQNLPVGIITDPTDPATFTALDTVEVTNTYTEYYFEYLAPTEDYIYLALKHGLDGTSDYYYIDDFVYEEIPPVPVMVLSDTTYDFGWVEEGTTPSWDVSITDDGSVDLIISGVDVNLPFSCIYPDTIPAGESDIATITLDALNPGRYNELLTFNTNAIGDSTIELSGIVYGSDYVMEGFEEITFPPFGWENPGNYWARFEEEAYEGDGYARCSWYHDADAILISPPLIIEDGDFIHFYWRNDNLYDSKGPKVITGDTLFVEISNDYLNPLPTWEKIAILSADSAMAEYEEVFVTLPVDYIGNDAKIRWRHRSELNDESRGVGLDNITMPAPYLPINFSVVPNYISDYSGAGTSINYTYDVTNTGIQTDRYIMLIQDTSAIRYNKRDIEDFETTDGGWVPTADWDPVGDWGWSNTYDVGNYTGSHTPPDEAHSGTGLWATVVNGDYTNAGGTSYLTKIFDFSSITDAYLRFWSWSDIFGSFDYGQVVVNGDILLTVDTYNPTSWDYFDLDLSAYDGMSDVQICFSFYATTVVEYAGWYIDDVDIPGGGGPSPGWPKTVNPPYLDINPGDTASFVLTISIPEDTNEEEGELTPVLVYSREYNDVTHTVLASALCHPKDPYEPNNTFADATPAEYGDVTEDAQIYYNPDYADYDVDIYKFDGSEGDVAYIVFDVADTLEFDGAIALLDADSVMLASADDGFGGDDEVLQYRLLNDGTFYIMLGEWSEVLEEPFKKELIRTETTTYYTASLELIPSPGVLVEPEEFTMGIIHNGKDTASDILYITNTGDEGAINLDWDIEIDIPGIETLLDEGFDNFPPDGWTAESNWVGSNSAYAGGTAPEAKFYYSPTFTGIRRLISPVINTSGYTSLPLKFKHYVNHYTTPYTLGVATTSDGGTTWNDVWTISPSASVGPETVSITLENSDVGSDNFQVCWYFDGYSYNINYWYIDDVNMATGEKWVHADPESGSVPQGATRTITIICDDATLEPGVHEATIIVHNNAELYGASDVTVPLTLNVEESAGGLQGTVTFITTGEPIDSVKVSCGNFVAYTDSNGFYEFDPVPPIGTYNILYHKDGFLDLWAYNIVLGDWITVKDVQMYFDGPAPTDLVAEGQHLCIDLTWHAPTTGGITQVEYVLDDGSYENGWCINPGYDAWLGNLFPVTDTGELVSFDLYADPYVGATTENVTIDVFDSGHNLVGTSDPFVIPAGTWTTVSVPNVPFDGEFYAMVHWNMLAGHTNWFGFDENGLNATANLDWYYDGSTWALLHVAAAATPGVFMLRATAMVEGELREITAGQVDYTPGVLPEEEITAMQNSLSSNSVFNLHYLTPPDEPGSYEVTTLTRDLILEGYNVYREDVTTGAIAYIPVEDPRFYRDEIVEAYVEYTYWVTAVYTVGESGPSNLASATPVCLNIEDFELDDGGYVGTGQWEWGIPTSGPGNAHSGVKLWATNLSGNYNNNSNYTLDSPEIVLEDNALLSFWHWYDTEASYDGGNVKISTDGGSTWTVITPLTGYTGVANTSNPLYPEPIFCGHAQGFWENVVFDLSAYVGETACFRWHFGSDVSVQYSGWYIDDVMIGLAPPPQYGALEGTVTDGWMNPIENATITAIGNLHPLERYCVTTNDTGYYEIDPIIAQFYYFTCEAEGFVTFTDTFTVLPGETYIEDVIMGNPTIDVTPDFVTITLDPNTQGTEFLTVSNDGNAPLGWYANIEEPDIDFTTNQFEGVTAPSMNAEVDPNQTTPYNPPTKDLWDILFSYDVDTPTSGTGIAGAEFGNGYFLVAEWGYQGIYRTVYKFDAEGNYISSWVPNWIPGTDGLRDMAFDGTYFYGSNVTNTIYQYDEDGNLYGTINSPVAVRSIAYDEDNDAFWVNNWDADLKLVDRSGNVLNTIYAPPSLYGTAYDNISEGGPYLWIFTGTTTGGGCQVEQYNLNTLTLTGVTHSVSGDFPGTIAGALFTSGDIVPGRWVLGGLAQGTPDILFGYDLGPYTTWIRIEPSSGTVPPGGDSLVTVYFDATDLVVGTIKTADIHFFSIPNVGDTIVAATLIVGTPEYGNLDGTVTDAGTTNPIEGVLITATSSGKQVYTDTTDVYGYYLIEDMLTGLYDVTFKKEGYNIGLEDAEILDDQTTTVNYIMTSPELIYTPASFTFQTAPGDSVVDTLYVENIGTGPVDFDIDIDYIYDKSRQSILCVDRDGSSPTIGYTDDWPYFEAALIAAGYTDYTHYEVVDISLDGPDLATMQLYDVIIWFSGESWGYFGHDCMTDNDEANLAAYLDGGGTLFLSAQDYFWASYSSAGSFSAGQFPYDYLGMRSVTQDNWLIGTSQGGPPTGTIEGVAGSLAEGYTFDVQDIYSAKDGLYIDWLTDFVADGLFNITSPTPEGICGIQYDAMTFRTVFTTASFAAITNTTVQTDLIDDIILWLSGGPPWLTVVPSDGTIDPSTTAPLTVTANSEGLDDSTYSAYINVNTSNPDIGATVIQVTFTVGPQSVGTGETLPLVTKLNSNFPNPFSYSTTISFSLKAKSHVKLSVYNMRGQLVATLIDGEMSPANHTVVWNGRNGNLQLANGIYFYKLEADKKTFIKKMLLMR